MKITVVGIGYVGLSNAVLLAQHNDVIALDIIREKVDLINGKKAPIADAEIEEFLATKELSLTATTDSYEAFKKRSMSLSLRRPIMIRIKIILIREVLRMLLPAC